MSESEQDDVAILLKASTGIKLPRGKKASMEAAKEAIASICSNAGEFNLELALADLTEKFGLKKREAKKESKKVGNDIDGKNHSPSKKKRSSANKSEPGPIGIWTIDPSHKSTMKELAERLMIAARERKIKVPTDNGVAIVACGQAIFSNKVDDSVNADEALKTLRERFGAEEEENAKKRSKAEPPTVEANTPIVAIFREMAGYAFKEQDPRKGAVWQKSATAINKCPWEITLDKLPTDKKGPMKLENVGKGSIEKIKEFLETGSVQQLEEMRSGL